MSLIVASRRLSLAQRYPGAVILDVTSRGPDPWLKFSPFYPHGNLPIPFSPGAVGASVEGIWQGLKVFETEDIDRATLANTSMRGIKRTVRAHGTVLGHRAGINGTALLPYAEARRQLYLPVYRWVLTKCVPELVAELRALSAAGSVVLLDYETNGDLDDLTRPLSHASLIKGFVAGEWGKKEFGFVVTNWY